ncbi:hypothetical protein TRFO_39923 [Tritrichomonas foetus]|uniref:RRM domain-containing protein n=1 Tax=Tritrichomonas foetus TaxID=1144522 RepID=A0A1J4J392_9EUKA|nr:hypothetical protein TRFO_39923 [Tritrichomonas foetus]|eukprot:OHS93920.1 hypothetical protein TRFO_39923 [Tritrichomonas foetus]
MTSKEIYYLQVAGFPPNYTRDKVRAAIEKIADSIIEVSIGFDQNFLIAVTFTGTREKCAEEISQLQFNGHCLTVNLVEEFPIMKKLPPAPMLYEDEFNRFPYFPDQFDGGGSKDRIIDKNVDSRPATKDHIESNNNYKMPPVMEQPVSPWSPK